MAAEFLEMVLGAVGVDEGDLRERLRRIGRLQAGQATEVGLAGALGARFARGGGHR